MAYRRGDPIVREWMREHPDETARVEKLYETLRNIAVEDLEELCFELMVDVAKRHSQYKDMLITDVVKCGVDKVLQLLAGQLFLDQTKEG